MYNEYTYIKLHDEHALKILQNLEQLNLIEIVEEHSDNNTKNLSDLLAESLTENEAKEMDAELATMRSGWMRNI